MSSVKESSKVPKTLSMTSKIRSMFNRQVSHPSNRTVTTVENNVESSSIMQEMKNVPNEFIRRKNYEKSVSSCNQDESSDFPVIVLRRKTGTKRHNTSLGAIEDLLQCPICKKRLKSPRMMPCQHTFCETCLDKQLEELKLNKSNLALTCPLCNLTVNDRTPELLPTNLYIESLLHVMENPGEGWLRLAERSTVSFAPLPIKNSDSEPPNSPLKSPGLTNSCSKCSDVCNKDNRCKHCKRFYCAFCWTPHVDELKNEFSKIVTQLETTSGRFANRVEDFRTKVDEVKDSIEKDIEARIAELMHEREERTKRLTYRSERGEESAAEVQRRLKRITDELKDQENKSYDELTDNNEKVKVFMTLHREATELMLLESTWNPEVGEADSTLENSKQCQIDLVTLKGDVDLFYRRKIFTPKLIINRELVQRPSGMAHDPWRDHVFVACPGIRQIVVLDRKFKLFKRYQNAEMMAPQGLAYMESTEELYVTDKWKHCIFVFNRKGEVVRQMCKKGQGESQLSCPEGLALHASRNLLYVADTGNDRIQILEFDGTWHGYIGPTERQANGITKSGKILNIAVNHLNQPTDVAVNDNCVIVADSGNHKIKIFNHEGVLVHTIGGSGTQRRYFRSPEVVELDSKGNIIVGDSGNARVQIFSAKGDLLRVLGGRGSRTNKFGWISGLLIKNNFDMMIADSKNNAVKLF